MTMNDLQSLQEQLSLIMDSDKVKLIDAKNIVDSYEGNDWNKYVKFDENYYNRSPIYLGDKFDIFVISWKKGQKSKIHDHPSRGCLMKVLKGELFENNYMKDSLLTPISSMNLRQGQIGYKESNSILHEIYSAEDSVSLHVYSPG